MGGIFLLIIGDVNTFMEKSWFVLRVTYSREMKVKEYLESEHIQCFVPLRYIYTIRKGKRERKLVPVVNNLIFVYSTRSELDELKRTSILMPLIRYVMDCEKKLPMIVPDKQMEDFMAVAGQLDEQIIYLSPDEVHLKEGDRVRINSGIWQGVEGVFVKMKGGMRVIVSIEGFMAVATIALHPSMVDKIS